MGRSAKAVLLLSLIGLSGCGEYLTFSKDSREQGLKDLEAGRTAEAQGAFRDAVRQNPRDAKSFYYLGTLYAKDRQFANAIANFRTSLDIQRTLTQNKAAEEFKLQTIDALAKTIAQSDAHDVEVNDLENRARSSTTGEEYLTLAQVYIERGDADSALDAYQKAADQAPDWFILAKRQALYLTSLNLKPQAEQALRKAYRLNDEDAEVNSALRKFGVIPGPALKEENELAKPIIPKGPLPPIYKAREQSPTASPASTPLPVPSPSPSPAPAD
ncbi:MAG TPA: tetratricopeptide repeat protein [Tepidisphaeraceae bacterium]|jgi:tetratricopeptide (TPR) repeat protein